MLIVGASTVTLVAAENSPVTKSFFEYETVYLSTAGVLGLKLGEFQLTRNEVLD